VLGVFSGSKLINAIILLIYPYIPVHANFQAKNEEVIIDKSKETYGGSNKRSPYNREM